MYRTWLSSSFGSRTPIRHVYLIRLAFEVVGGLPRYETIIIRSHPLLFFHYTGEHSPGALYQKSLEDQGMRLLIGRDVHIGHAQRKVHMPEVFGRKSPGCLQGHPTVEAAPQ